MHQLTLRFGTLKFNQLQPEAAILHGKFASAHTREMMDLPWVACVKRQAEAPLAFTCMGCSCD